MKKDNSNKKPHDEWGCKWLITLNAPSLTALLMEVKISDLPVNAIAWKVSVEIGESGNLHKHIYVVLERSWRKSSLISRFKHLGAQFDRITPGTEQTVIFYIGNHDKEVSKGCYIVDEYCSIFGEIDSTQGQRNDISASDAVLWQIKDAVDGGACIREIWNDFFPYMVRYGSGISSYYSQYRNPRIVTSKKEKPKEELSGQITENVVDELEPTIEAIGKIMS